jgi:hypothetical protein
MTVLGAIRPDDWNLPLFLHILGAMTLVGALALVVLSLASARGGDSAAGLRVAYRALLLAAIPSWIVMRLAGQWIADKEGLTDLDEPPAWVDIGFVTSEPTLLLLIAATVCAGIAARRAREGGGRSFGGLNTAALVLVTISLLAYVLAIWAMSTKPV